MSSPAQSFASDMKSPSGTPPSGFCPWAQTQIWLPWFLWQTKINFLKHFLTHLEPQLLCLLLVLLLFLLAELILPLKTIYKTHFLVCTGFRNVNKLQQVFHWAKAISLELVWSFTWFLLVWEVHRGKSMQVPSEQQVKRQAAGKPLGKPWGLVDQGHSKQCQYQTVCLFSLMLNVELS